MDNKKTLLELLNEEIKLHSLDNNKTDEKNENHVLKTYIHTLIENGDCFQRFIIRLIEDKEMMKCLNNMSAISVKPEE